MDLLGGFVTPPHAFLFIFFSFREFGPPSHEDETQVKSENSQRTVAIASGYMETHWL